MLEEQLGRRGDAVAPLEPMLQRTLADIQERLTFRAQVGARRAPHPTFTHAHPTHATPCQRIPLAGMWGSALPGCSRKST